MYQGVLWRGGGGGGGWRRSRCQGGTRSGINEVYFAFLPGLWGPPEDSLTCVLIISGVGTWATHPLPPSLLPSPSLFCDNYSLFSLVSPSSYSSSTYFHSLLSLPPSLFVLTFIPLHPSLSPSRLQPLPQPSLPFLFPPHSSSVFFMLLFFSSLIHFLSLLPVYPSLSPSFVLLICPFLFISLPLMHFLPIHFFSFPFLVLFVFSFSSTLSVPLFFLFSPLPLLRFLSFLTF